MSQDQDMKVLNGNNSSILRVSIVYMVTGFAVFALMGFLGLFMRLVHGGVELSLFGQTLKFGEMITPEWFYSIMTLHGSGMVAANLLAAMGGFAAAASKSLKLSSKLLWTVFVIYFLGAGFAIASTMIGRFGAGWTVLHPLPFKGNWDLWAAIAIYLGYLFIAVAFLLYCLNLLYATVKANGGLGKALAWPYLFSGGTKGKDKLPSPVEILAGVVAIDGIITVLAGATLLVPIFAEAAGLVEAVDALFAKNLLFLFGHTLVNLNIYLAAGLLYSTLPAYTGRQWKTTWPLALALNLVIIMILLPYFHHLYQDFAQSSILHILGLIGSYGVALPAFLVSILGGLSMMYRSGMRWSVPSILIALGLWGWTFGGLGAVIDSTIPVNQVMHNTLWVPAHFHTYYLLGAVAFAWAFMYHLIFELSNAKENIMSKLSAWLYGIGGAGFVIMFFVSGANSVPRRYAAHEAQWQGFAQIASIFVVVLAVGMLWLAIEMLARLAKAWRGTTEPAN